MKNNLKIKKLLSYLLIFTMIFTLLQMGQVRVTSAATTSDDSSSEATEFMNEISITTNLSPSTPLEVDEKGSSYVLEYLNMGVTNISIKSNDDWKISSVTSSTTNVSVTQQSTSKYQISNIQDYSDFSITIVISDGDETKTYNLKIRFDTEDVLQFQTIRITDSNNSSNVIDLDYDDVQSDGYYRTTIGEDVSSVKIQLYDDSSALMSTGVTINGSSSGTVKLVGGDNAVTIKVTRNSVTKIYNLIIDKKGQALLKSLVPSTGSLSPAFSSDVEDYTISVPTTQTSIAFTPTSIDNSSKIKVNGITVTSGKKSTAIDLDEGENDILIELTTDDGDTATYTIVVTRAEQFRSTALTALKLTSGTLSPTFNKGVYEYTATVENTITSIGVTPKAEDSNATIEVNGKEVPSGATSSYISLDEGVNVITITVTYNQDNTATYVINVTRRYGKDNVNLESLTITDGTLSPSFDSDTYLYSVKVDRSIEKVRAKFTSQNDKATIKINGKSYTSGQQSDYIKLDIGANLVTVDVVAEDKKTTTNYKLSIIRGEIEGTNQWVLVSGNWTFYNAAEVQVKNEWVKYDNQWYFLDINGYMKTGWLNESGNWYYLNQNGIMQTGWFYEKGYWYYLQGDGSMRIDCWAQYDGIWYFFNGYGQLQTGWTLYKGYWYYMNEKGAMQKGWITYDKNKYYLNDDGTMKTGWLYSGSVWYYFDSSGVMKTGWQTINGKNYYFDANGRMKTGMMFLDGKWINLDNA